MTTAELFLPWLKIIELQRETTELKKLVFELSRQNESILNKLLLERALKNQKRYKFNGAKIKNAKTDSNH